MNFIVRFILDEIPRQRKSYKRVAFDLGIEHDTFYRWREGKPKNINIDLLERVLKSLGYDLVILRSELTVGE